MNKLRYGMVGGGQGALFGDTHRKAIALDSLAELSSGCFSRSPENTAATGQALGVAAERCYEAFEEMAEAEAKRHEKIDFVVVVTPNASHFEVCKVFLNRGINVVCDKPLTFEVAEAEELSSLAKKNNLLFAVTYTYLGYPAVKQIREMVRSGEIGEVRFVSVEYLQEWLAAPIEKGEHKQAKWRTDPKISGKVNCLGDIGVHAESLAAYTTGLKIKSACARLDKIVEGRVLDDNASIMLEYEGGAKGLYWASQIAIGCENCLRLRILGSLGTLHWFQEQPNNIDVYRLGKPKESWSRGRESFYPLAMGYSRIAGGHPEGFIEALANIYKAYTGALLKRKKGESLSEADLDFPSVEMGRDGVKFIDKCVESSAKGAVWVNF